MKYRLLLIGISLLFLGSCSSNDEDQEDQINFDQTAFLQNEANIIVEAYNEFDLRISELTEAVDTFRNTPDLKSLNEVQAKFKQAYLGWQLVSHFEFGPAESLGLKSNLNIFPTDTNLIESNISSGSGSYNLDALNSKSAKGLAAIDYVIHHQNDSQLVQAFNDPDRMQYLIELCVNARDYSQQALTQWNNYKGDFISAKGTSVGSGSGMLVNALNQHYERFFRDGKIGIPLGVRSSGISRPKYVEAYYSAYSMELAVANFKAMKDCYLGKSGIGLDDYLRASDAEDLVQRIQSQIDLIDSKLQGIQDPLSKRVNDESQKVSELYSEIQKLIVYWKVDLPSRLGILISYQDNDGD